MKTMNLTKTTKNNQNQVINIKNRTAMKTRISKKIASVLAIAAIGIFSVNSAFGQFVGSNQTDQTPIEERKGNTSTYTVPGPATDEYSWQVVGGTVVSTNVAPSAAITGSGTSLDPYIVPFTAGLQSIEVEWPADDNTITSISGNVSVQRQVAGATVQCPSFIQSLDVDLWSSATASIQGSSFEMCSGDATPDTIVVDLTGAPNFSLTYTITDLTGTTGAPQTVNNVTGGTYAIDIPDNLINTSATDDQTYIVTLTAMNDDFLGVGTIINSTYTITVHPTIQTGEITSSGTLTRRP
jgi:hypothetical protein